MVEFEGKKYISTKEAAKLTGYTSDYIGQLARSKKILSRMVGRARYVEEASILGYVADAAEATDNGGRKPHTHPIVVPETPKETEDVIEKDEPEEIEASEGTNVVYVPSGAFERPALQEKTFTRGPQIPKDFSSRVAAFLLALLLVSGSFLLYDQRHGKTISLQPSPLVFELSEKQYGQKIFEGWNGLDSFVDTGLVASATNVLDALDAATNAVGASPASGVLSQIGWSTYRVVSNTIDYIAGLFAPDVEETYYATFTTESTEAPTTIVREQAPPVVVTNTETIVERIVERPISVFEFITGSQLETALNEFRDDLEPRFNVSRNSPVTVIPSHNYLLLDDTPSQFTANSIPFTNSVGNALTNAANFVFDGSRLGVGTTTPGTLLSLNGVANFDTATSTFYSSGGIDLSDGCFSINGTCVEGGGSGSSDFAWTTTGYGVSTSTTLGFLDGFLSTASSTITGVLKGASGIFSSYLDAEYFVATSTTATSTFAGDLSVDGLLIGDGATLDIDPDGDSTPEFQFTSSQFFVPDGSSEEPAIAFSSETGTGFNYSGGDLYITRGGSTAAVARNGSFTFTGDVGIGTTTPGTLLSLNGVANFDTATSTFYSSGGIDLSDGCFSINGTCVEGGGSGVWGAITGTLSNQTDLQSALDARLTLTDWFATTTDGLAQGSANLYNQTHTGDVTGATSLAIANDVVAFTDILYSLTLAGNPAFGANESYFALNNGILFEGSTADTLEGLLTSANITGSDKTWTLPNTTGNIALTTSAMTGTFDGNNFAGSAIGSGDILYGASAGSIAELAGAATGNSLLSGGVTGAPSWGKIGLTTHVSGTLGVGNGGTGAATFGQGWLHSAGGTSAFTSSTSPTVNYIFATSTTASSTISHGLNVFAVNQTGSATSTFAQGIDLSAGCFSINGTCVDGGSGGSDFAWTIATNYGETVSATSSPLWIQENLYASSTVYAPSFVGTDTAGTSTLPNISATQLLVGGDYITDFTGSNLSITNGVLNAAAASSVFEQTDATTIEATSTNSGLGLKLDYFTATSSSATSTFAGGFDAGSGGLVYDFSSGNVIASGLLDIQGVGTSTFTGNVTTTGDIAGDQLFLTGATSTAANGIDIATGCFSINGTCVGGGSSGISIGDAITGGTGGSVLFVDGSGNLAQNNTNFYWDDTNIRFGLGTTSPTTLLTVGSTTPNSIAAGNYYNSAFVSGDLEVDGTIYGTTFTGSADCIDGDQDGNCEVVASGGLVAFDPDDDGGNEAWFDSDGNLAVRAGSGEPSIFNAADSNTGINFAGSDTLSLRVGAVEVLTIDQDNAVAYFDSSHNVGIGTSSPYAKLSVVGEIVGSYFTGTTTATSTFGGNLAINGTGTTTSAGGFDITDGCFAVDGTCITGGGGAFTSSGGFTTLDTITDFVGIGTTTPYAELSVVGDTVLDSNNITFGSSTASLLNVFYGAAATSTITNGDAYAWTIGTSTDSLPIFRIDTSSTTAKATTTIDGGFSVNSGALHYDYSANKTSIERLDLGAQSFETDAGTVQWVDLPISSSPVASTTQSYTAQIDDTNILTIYGQTDGSGGLKNPRVIVGTTTDAVMGNPNIPYNSLIVADGILCVDDSAGADCDNSVRTRGGVYAEAGSIAGLDLAETYPTKDTDLNAGDIVVLDPNNPIFVTKVNPETADNSIILGIVSTKPGLTLGGFKQPELLEGESQVPIALAGRVPVKISDENGVIAVGNDLTYSKIEAGYAAKALPGDEVIGIALEPYSGGDSGEFSTEIIEDTVKTAGDVPGINNEMNSKPTIVEGGVDTILVFVDNRKDTDLSGVSVDSLLPSEEESMHPLFQAVLNALADIGVMITDGMTRIANLTAWRLTVGNTATPAGITLFDELTGEPYCLSIRGGETKATPGECGSVEVPNEDDSSNEEDDTETDNGNSGGGDGEVGGTSTTTDDGSGSDNNETSTTTDNGSNDEGGDTSTSTDDGGGSEEPTPEPEVAPAPETEPEPEPDPTPDPEEEVEVEDQPESETEPEPVSEPSE